MTIQQLKSFLIACDELNFTRAAERCYISRQALRQNITTLEQELCGPLFENRNNRLSLTPKGELLRREAAPIIADFDRLMQTMTADIKQQKAIRLGISYSLVPSYLPQLEELLEHYAEEHKKIALKTVNMNNGDIVPALLADEIDCGMVTDLRSCTEGLKRTELSAHTAAIQVSERNAFFGRKEITPIELEGSCICMPSTGVEMAPLSANISIRTMEIPNYYQAYYMVRQEGIAALDRSWAGDEADRFTQTIPIKGLTICSAFLCCPDNHDPDIQLLRDFLKSEIRHMFE